MRSVTYHADVPLPGTIVTVRDLEAKHRFVRIAVPETWDELLERLRNRCLYSDSSRIYYSIDGLEPTKKKLASAADFDCYFKELGFSGQLPDLWMLRAAGAPSPEQLLAPEAAAAAGAGGGGGAGGGAASSGRSSAQQSAFRHALLLRDAGGSKDACCALCGSVSDVQAAHILPQGRSDQFSREESLETAMVAAGLASVYDTCNGFLLCDQCHDFFDAFLWSVDKDRKVVVSGALAANVPALAGFAGKQLFPDEEGASLVSVNNRPLPGVWAWHFEAYRKTTAARRAKAALELFACGRCQKRFVQQWRRDDHESVCLAAQVPAKHFTTPARKAGLATRAIVESGAGAAAASASAAAGGGGAARGGSGARGGARAGASSARDSQFRAASGGSNVSGARRGGSSSSGAGGGGVSGPAAKKRR